MNANERIMHLRDQLWVNIQKHVPDAMLNGPPMGERRLTNHIHLCIPGIPSEPLINALSAVGVCASGGSACSTGRFSPVLTALGRSPEEGAFIRITLGRFNTLEDIDSATLRLTTVVNELREVYA